MRLTHLLLVVGALGLSACLNVDQPSGSPSDPATETFASSLQIDIGSMQKTALGVYYRDITVGTGDVLTKSGPVDITYAGFLKTGFLFDSGQLTGFDITQSVVGLQDGMMGMRVGGERVIVIPSAYGYGDGPVGPIPANSTLVFDVKLTQIY